MLIRSTIVALAGNGRVLGEVDFVQLPCALGSHFAKHLLCYRCGFLAVNFNRSKVFVLFCAVGKIFLNFFLYMSCIWYIFA